MKSRRGPWLVFGVCGLGVAAALAWITVLVLRLERAEEAARAEANQMEAMRLALWRMDSWLAPRLARESARPYYEYLPYYPQPTAYTRIFNVIDEGEVITPSPLLTFQSPYFRLHFQIDARGVLTSPQVPQGNMRDVAQSTVLAPDMLAASDAALANVDELLGGAGLRGAAELAAACSIALAPESLAMRGPPEDALAGIPPQQLGMVNAPPTVQAALDPQQWIAENTRQQQLRSQAELASRSKISSDASAAYQTTNAGDGPQTVWSQSDEYGVDLAQLQTDDAGAFAQTNGAEGGGNEVVVGQFVPRWVSDADRRTQLIFVRQIVRGEQRLYQGFVMDWPALREAMLGEVQDLLAGPKLQPVWSGEPADEFSSRMLATVPVLLIAETGVGMAPAAGVATAWLTPARTVVVVTWLAAIVAVLAVGMTLRASISYGERRSRFASAVTHELRTPLTTFQMYSEMLAEGMVRSDEQRKSYLTTLRDESRRLGTLVENILSYARLEEGRHIAQARAIGVGELLDRVQSGLQRRADNAGMSIRVHCDASRDEAVLADADIVGQILLNLVDNACKYARHANGSGAIELLIEGAPSSIRFIVQDNGPGIDEAHARRIFAPFDRGVRQEGDGTPGVGLGLALARGLARDLGGDLTLDQRCASGARFVLALPRA